MGRLAHELEGDADEDGHGARGVLVDELDAYLVRGRVRVGVRVRVVTRVRVHELEAYPVAQHPQGRLRANVLGEAWGGARRKGGGGGTV